MTERYNDENAQQRYENIDCYLARCTNTPCGRGRPVHVHFFSPSLPSLPSLMHSLVPLHHNSSGFLFLSSAMAGCKLLRYVCLFLLGNVGAVTATCEKINDCSCRMSDGKVLNLKSLDKNPGPR